MKKYNGTAWVDTTLRQYKTATADIEPTIYTDGTAITSYTIKGNTVQSGTPTPSNPVEVNGVGVRTENSFDKDRTTGIIANAYINQSGQQASSSNYYISYPIEVDNNATYTWSFNSETGANHSSPTVAFYDSSDNMLGVATHNNGVYHFTFTTPNNCAYIRASVFVGLGMDTGMLLQGSVSVDDKILLPYIPYGFKIPISNGQQTIDIYIGDLPLLKSLDGTAVDEISNGTLTRRVNSDGSVLPTPTTTQITMPSIPTTEGANSITVDTTVQPSEFTATWTGWHDSSVKEWDGTNWQ